MVRNNYPLMRVDKKLKKLLHIINEERARKGMKRLSARKLTARLAVKFLKHGAMIDDEFIKF